VTDDDVDESVESQDERRAHDRARLILDIFFDGQDVTGVASTKDISPGGLYMNTQANIPEGAFLMVRIPFSKDVQVVCNAEVIYSNPGQGVGLRFHDVPDEVRATLEREVSKHE
jgi:PilZ domain-containing protein